jgi:hypothetical protein
VDRRRTAAVVLALTLVAACGSDDESSGPATTAASGGWLDGGGSMAWEEAEASGGTPLPGATTAAAEGDLRTGEDAAGSAVGAGDDAATTVPEVGLNAGWVDDNEAWDDYLRYRETFASLGIAVDDVPVEQRRIVTVVDGEGRPVLDARVVITDASGAVVHDARTHADGRTLFFPQTVATDGQQRTAPWEIRVERGDAAQTGSLDPELLEYELVLDGATRAPLQLDVLFLIDATGSMADEIERLKANMISVAEEIAALPAAPDLRLAMTVYRDAGDLFVTRTFDFTPDVAAFTGALADVVADGGGDWPEALDEALAESLTAPAWRADGTVRLVFLLADAPPHIADGAEATEGNTTYATSVLRAVRDGVKILPIASSDTDPQAEYVFRQLAQITDAPFVFLTYGADGASPGELTDLEVEDYSVLPLDELVVRLVADELAPQV